MPPTVTELDAEVRGLDRRLTDAIQALTAEVHAIRTSLAWLKWAQTQQSCHQPQSSRLDFAEGAQGEERGAELKGQE